MARPQAGVYFIAWCILSSLLLSICPVQELLAVIAILSYSASVVICSFLIRKTHFLLTRVLVSHFWTGPEAPTAEHPSRRLGDTTGPSRQALSPISKEAKTVSQSVSHVLSSSPISNPTSSPTTDRSSPGIESKRKPCPYKKLLTEHSIRLLQLQPGSGTDPITCTLTEVDVRHAPKYEAISYFWGDQAFKEDVLLNGAAFPIGINLRDALQRIRLPNTMRLVWADFICIDQTDEPERTAQVKLMGSVYRNADRVLVWLGQKDEHSIAAFEIITGINALFGVGVNLQVTPEQVLAFDEAYPWTLVRAFFDHRDWFHRVWTAQELGLARSAVMLCGEDSISWESMDNFLLWIEGPGKLLDQSLSLYLASYRRAWVTYAVFENHARGVSPVFTQDDDRKMREEMDFLEVLECSWLRRSTREVDYINAFLGHPKAMINGNLIIEPKYEGVTYEQVYADLVPRVVSVTKDLRILSHVVHHVKNGFFDNGNIPTWAPRWNLDNHMAKLGHTSYSIFKASAGLLPAIQVSPDRKMLSASGVLFDEISWRSETMNTRHFQSELDGWLPLKMCPVEGTWAMYKYLDGRSPYSRSPDARLDAFALTLASGRRFLQMNSKMEQADMEQFRRDFWAYRLKAFESASFALDKNEKGWNTRFQVLDLGRSVQTVKTKMQQRAEGGSASDFLLSANQACHYRRFFMTTRGYFGIGPERLQTWDTVAVLFGGKTPYVLSAAADSCFKFLGECYVHGIMDGEVVDMLNKGELKEQTIQLL